MPHAHKFARLPLTAIAALALATTALTCPAMAAEFPPVIQLSSLNGTTGFRLDGIDSDDYSGFSVSSAGDVNGDGFGDLVIGAWGGDPNEDDRAGESYVVFGKGSGGFASVIDLGSLNGSNGFRLDGINVIDQSGYSVASAGDVNGDGFGDLIIGAFRANSGGYSYVGESYVVFGKASGYTSAIDLAGLDSATGFRLDGIDDGDFSGFSVASAGDVNGDGFADLVIGARLGDPNGNSAAGESYVVFGKASSFASVLDLGSLDGVTGFRLDGLDVGDNSGRSVAAAGDVNGDGFGDVIIGAFRADPSGDSSAGESYVVFGQASGFTSAIDLASLNGATGFRLDGIDAYDYSGISVAGAGDVNGDGFADVIVGAYRSDSNQQSWAGESYVVFGKSAAFASAIDLASLNGATGFRLDGVDAYDFSGHSVASAGDVNGDGFSDILIGAYGADANGDSNAGKSYVVFGKPAGYASVIDLASLNGTTGFRLDGIVAYDNSGHSVASAGDVNGDGFADLVIGADGANYDVGSSYVVFGRVPNGPRTRGGSAADQYISGGRFNDTLSGLGGDDELEGRGGGDALRGGNGRDAASYAHANNPVLADLAVPAGNTGDAAGDSYDRIENLAGSRFADTLSGNAAANVLTGGGWRDTLSGRGGADIFKYEKLADSPPGLGRDKVTDFDAGTAGTSVDRIDLSAIDADSIRNGNQAFSFIGTNPFSNVKGQLRVQQSGPHAIVIGDVNGNGVADFEIVLLNFSNLAGMTRFDFIR